MVADTRPPPPVTATPAAPARPADETSPGTPTVGATPKARPRVHTLLLLAAPRDVDFAVAESLDEAVSNALPDLDVQIGHDAPATATPIPHSIALVRPPQDVLAEALAAHRDADPAVVLAQWAAPVRGWLRQAQRAPAVWAFIEAGPGAAQATARALGHFGLTVDLASGWTCPDAPTVDPLVAELAAALVRQDARTRALHDEALAACWPGDRAAAADTTAAAALSRWQALGAEADRLRGELAAADAAMQQAQIRWDAERGALAEQRTQSEQALAGRIERAAQALADRDAEVRQLAGERGAFAERAAQAALALADREATYAQTAAEADQARHALAEATTALRQAQDRLEAQRGTLADRESEVEQLMSQVLDLRTLVRGGTPGGATVGGVGPVHGRRPDEVRLQLVKAHDAGTHRHLHLRGEGLRVDTRPLPPIEFRLAEHHGRPALVVFATPGSPEPLAAWAPDGHEADRAYMQLVPTDDAGRARAQRLGTSDWQVVRMLARAVRAELASGRLKAAPRWIDVARRLDAQLDAHADRLRYDRLDLVPGADAGPGRLVVALRHASRKDQLMGDIVLEMPLRAGAVQPDLAWHLPPAGQPLPLQDWPVAEDGQLAPLCPVPLPLGPDPAGARSRWDVAGAPARALVLALLEALPGLRHAGGDLVLPAGVSGATLSDGLSRLHRDVRRADALWRARGLWARVWRRAAGRAGGAGA